MADFAFRSSADERRRKSEKRVDPIKKGKPMTSRNMEDRTVDEQITKIRNRFGDEVANKANYGWGVGGDKRGVSVATKVYHPKGNRVLTSDAQPGDTNASHRWDKY